MKSKSQYYSHIALRVVLGLLMLVPGVIKLMDPSKPLALLTKIGFPAPSFFVWVLIASEILFGLALIVGYKVRYTVWPLIVVLLVAVVTVTIPGKNPSSILFHLLAIIGLFHLFANGSGGLAVDKD